MEYCYIFETSSIQEWIFSGGKLRDVVGASLQLDHLCSWDGEDLFEEALSASGLKTPKDTAIVRRGGGGVIALGSNKSALVRLRAIFTLKVRVSLPDLIFSDAFGEGQDSSIAHSDARAKLIAAQSAPPLEPQVAGPFHLLAPRTGTPATERDPATGDFLDRGTLARRAEGRKTRAQIEAKFDRDGIADFPREMSEDGFGGGAVFPFLGENTYVGLIHADGNEIGAVWRSLSDAGVAPEHLALFSKSLEAATAAAARHAMQGIKAEYDHKAKDDPRMALELWPVRPLILAGDDLTAIVRGDHAITFARDFLAAFEEETELAFSKIRKEVPSLAQFIPERASAGAGIAFVKANQPFQRAYLLCESLAEFAKSTAKASKTGSAIAAPALVAFHRVSTSAFPTDWTELSERELDQGNIRLTASPYQVETKSSVSGIPMVESLEHLTEALCSRVMARGPIRELTPEFFNSGWPMRWQRIVDVAEARDPDAFAIFEQILKDLGCADGPTVDLGSCQATPLFDALSWATVARHR